MKKRDWLFIIIGILLILYSCFIMAVSNFNVGVVIPLALGVPLCIFGIFRRTGVFSRGFGKFIKVFAAICYIIFIACFAAFSIFVATASNEQPKKGADAVIVLGAAVHGDEPTLTLQKRLDKAIEYANENTDTIIIVSGGKGAQESVSEAEAMAKYLKGHGIDGARIVEEDEASSTYENFEFSKGLLNDLAEGEPQVVFVTSDFHIFRAEQVARAVGFGNIEGLAAKSVWYMKPCFYSREMVAILMYYITGLV